MRIWQVIRRGKWVIITALIVVALVAVTGSLLITPSYQASSKILIMKAKKNEVDIGTNGSSGVSAIFTTSSDVDVNRVLATSRPYVDKMVYKLQLRDEEGDLISADNLAEAGIVSAIKGRVFPKPSVSISQYQETDILQVKATSPDPQEAMMMANTLAEIMVGQNQTQLRAQYRSARTFLEAQMDKVKEGYNTGLREINDFKKQEKTLNLAIETKLAVEKMADLLNDKENTVIELAQARARLGRLKEHLAKQTPEFLSASTLKENPHIGVLKKRLTELKLQLSEATSQLTESHPQVQSLRSQITVAEEELKREIEVYCSSAPELTSLQKEIAALEAHLKGVNADFDQYFKSLEAMSDKAFKQASLDLELKAMPEAYSLLLDSLYQTGVAEATTLSEIRVIEPAIKAVSPTYPNKALNGVLGALMGLVFGCGLVFIRELLDDTIRTAEDVKLLSPIAFIGTVPRFGAQRTPLISARDPNDPLYESYRRIRTQFELIEHVRHKPLQSLLITSAGPEEGKSTTAANLGISVAREGKKVVIIDMDLRRPSLHAYFDLPNDAGLADVLQGTTALNEGIQPTRVRDLSIISSGPPFPDPGALIESDNTGPLISELRARYDLVILDSAPLLVKSDALVLAQHVDGSVIVLDSEKTTRRAVDELMKILASAHITPLGVILNRYSIEKGKYFYHQYYYGHYSRELSASESSR
jgi:tyrosine-protein kinase Etk/Wzc